MFKLLVVFIIKLYVCSNIFKILYARNSHNDTNNKHSDHFENPNLATNYLFFFFSIFVCCYKALLLKIKYDLIHIIKFPFNIC